MSDYYKILEVNKDATVDDIKKSYRNLCKKYHPDVSKLENSENKFREIQEAYEILSDEGKRQQYDRFGSVDNSGSGHRYQSHGFNFEDIFSQFGDIFGNSYKQPRPRKGSDLKINLNITLSDVIFGSSKKVKIKRQKPCNTCNGKGGTDVKDCTLCKGSGHRTMTQQTPFGVFQQTVPCGDCNHGKVVSNKCKSCNGVGTSLEEETINMNIPKGVSNGMSLCMQGYGNHTRDGQPGDLLIYIDEVPDPKFRRDGSDLFCEEWISIPDAVLGTIIKIPTLNGDVDVKVDEGCESGKVFSFTGKGVPYLHPNGHVGGNGSLYVRVNVKIPTNISNEQKELYKELKNLS